MLEYENELFLDILNDDGLVISAKGLSVTTVLVNLLKVYCESGNLVLVLGALPSEEEYFVSQLADASIKPLPKIITNEFGTNEREGIYLQGGVMFISSRILVVDLLKGRVPIEYITGFIILKAHKILESCQEAFALRLFRQKNKTGFIKAFSSSPVSFTTSGFSHLSRVMKALFVKNIFLLPRFRNTVKSSFSNAKPSVVEIHLELTKPMLELQTAILDLIRFTINEIKRLNPSIDIESLTVENVIAKSFYKLLMVQMDSIWHQLSGHTKQLIRDLKILKNVLSYLTRTDCVNFNNFLSSLRKTNYALKSGGWVLLSAAETLFIVSKERVVGTKNNIADHPEINPKWTALTEILKEINNHAKECYKTHPEDGQERILILVENIKSCNQIKEYLLMGGKTLMTYLYQQTLLVEKELNANINNVDIKEANQEIEEDIKESYILTQKLDPIEDKLMFESCTHETLDETMNKTLSDYQPPIIFVETLKKYMDPESLTKTLNILKPRYIVMYDIEMFAIRNIECFQAKNPIKEIQVFFLLFGGSVEEQAYLTSLRREKEAFDSLINEKATLVVANDQDGKGDLCPELDRDPKKANETVSSGPQSMRKGGVSNTVSKTTPTVIVDMREFRSELPGLIHRRGIEIEPITILVGDYILTDDICVERKSISDLIGSLNSGRLYTQVLSMTRHYTQPMLLIEFEHEKPFVLQGQYYISRDVSSKDITAKLQLLTLHFPQLRLIWSPSPYASAELFEELKRNKPEPDAAKAALIGGANDQMKDDNEKYNPVIFDIVGKLPGVTTKNIYRLLNKVDSLVDLITLSKDEITTILDNSKEATSLYNALHMKYNPLDELTGPLQHSYKNKGRGFKKRKIT